VEVNPLFLVDICLQGSFWIPYEPADFLEGRAVNPPFVLFDSPFPKLRQGNTKHSGHLLFGVHPQMISLRELGQDHDGIGTLRWDRVGEIFLIDSGTGRYFVHLCGLSLESIRFHGDLLRYTDEPSRRV
jgi:hypothetical protein